ncbi:MAG: hypothetical protein VKJ24_15885 [Synechococcales bacterium]|nr:hypothetical protein [Synechococcales bacterium]
MQIPLPAHPTQEAQPLQSTAEPDILPVESHATEIAASIATPADSERSHLSPVLKILLAIALGLVGTGVLTIGSLYALSWVLTEVMGPDICKPLPAPEQVAPPNRQPAQTIPKS